MTWQVRKKYVERTGQPINQNNQHGHSTHPARCDSTQTCICSNGSNRLEILCPCFLMGHMPLRILPTVRPYPLSQPQTLTLTLAKTALLRCSLRQYPLYSKLTPPAVLADHFTPQVFEKSQIYGKHKAKFSIISGLYKQFIDTLQLASCLYYPWAWKASGQLLGLAGYGSEYLV